MITLKQIKLHNFLSHEDTKIDFRPQQKLLIDGRSGAGKSAIVEALLWGLYGRGRSDNRSLLKRGKVSGYVSIILEDDGIFYLIRRGITNKGKHTLELETCKVKDLEDLKLIFRPVPISGLKQIQDFIENQLLHSSYTLFINSVIYPQDNPESFIRQPASRRKDLLLEITNISKFEEYYEKVRIKVQSLEAAKQAINASIATIKGFNEDDLKELEKEPKYLEEIAQWKEKKTKTENLLAEIEKKVEDCEKKIDTINSLREEIESMGEKSKQIREKIEENELELKKYDVDGLNDLKAKIIDLAQNKELFIQLLHQEEEHAQWNQQMMTIMSEMPVKHDYDAEIAGLNRQLIDLIKLESSEQNNPYFCPSCGTPIDKAKVCPELHLAREQREAQKNYLNNEIKARTERKNDYLAFERAFLAKKEALGDSPAIDPEKRRKVEKTIAEQEEIKDFVQRAESGEKAVQEEKLKNLKDTYAELDAKFVELHNKRTTLVKEVEEYVGLKAYLGGVQLSLDSILIDIRTLETSLSMLEKTKKDIAKRREDVVKKEEEIKTYEEQLELLSLLKDAFSQNGIKAIMVDYILPKLEDKINFILSQLSDFRVRLETQRPGIGDNITLEGLFITIINELGQEFDFDNFSGGEKLKIIVAISEALADIQKVNFRVMDEIWIGLDEESTERFADVMDTIQKRFGQLLCISHLRNIKDIFDDKITVVKTNGTSRLV